MGMLTAGVTSENEPDGVKPKILNSLFCMVADALIATLSKP